GDGDGTVGGRWGAVPCSNGLHGANRGHQGPSLTEHLVLRQEFILLALRQGVPILLVTVSQTQELHGSSSSQLACPMRVDGMRVRNSSRRRRPRGARLSDLEHALRPVA